MLKHFDQGDGIEPFWKPVEKPVIADFCCKEPRFWNQHGCITDALAFQSMPTTSNPAPASLPDA